MAVKKTVMDEAVTPTASQNSYHVLDKYKNCSSVVVDGTYVEIVDGKITTTNPAKYEQFIGKV